MRLKLISSRKSRTDFEDQSATIVGGMQQPMIALEIEDLFELRAHEFHAQRLNVDLSKAWSTHAGP